MAKFLILCIDGGGVRGAFAARMVELLNYHYKIMPKVNLLAGTSTGAIIASCLAQNFPPSRIVALYKASSKTIFTRNFFLGPRFIEKALKSSYDSIRFKAVLKQIYGKITLGESKIPLVIPTTDLKGGGPQLFKSYSHDENERNLPLYEAVVASCSAPTYFNPAVIGPMLLADGGMWSNNPSFVALSEARRSFEQSMDHLQILSIGTGHFNNCFDENNRYWGLINGWKIRNLTEFISSLQAQSTYETLKKVLEPHQLLRLNFSQSTLLGLDDFSQIDKLIARADVVFKRDQEQIEQFLSRL